MADEVTKNLDQLDSKDAPAKIESSPLSTLSAGENKDIFSAKGSANTEALLPSLSLEERANTTGTNPAGAEKAPAARAGAGGDNSQQAPGKTEGTLRGAVSEVPRKVVPADQSGPAAIDSLAPSLGDNSQLAPGKTEGTLQGAVSEVPLKVVPADQSGRAAIDSLAPSLGDNSQQTKPAERATDAVGGKPEAFSSKAPQPREDGAAMDKQIFTDPPKDSSDEVPSGKNEIAAHEVNKKSLPPPPAEGNSDINQPGGKIDAPTGGGITDNSQSASNKDLPLNQRPRGGDGPEPSRQSDVQKQSIERSDTARPSGSDAAPKGGNVSNAEATARETVRNFLDAVKRKN